MSTGTYTMKTRLLKFKFSINEEINTPSKQFSIPIRNLRNRGTIDTQNHTWRVTRHSKITHDGSLDTPKSHMTGHSTPQNHTWRVTRHPKITHDGSLDTPKSHMTGHSHGLIQALQSKVTGWLILWARQDKKKTFIKVSSLDLQHMYTNRTQT
jgi:hypothetical protein